jgi:hypothetical protein
MHSGRHPPSRSPGGFHSSDGPASAGSTCLCAQGAMLCAMSDPKDIKSGPAAVGDTHADEGVSEGTITRETTTGTERHRKPTETEQRPDQEQETRAYPRTERGHFDPREALDEDANPSDPSSYTAPEEVDPSVEADVPTSDPGDDQEEANFGHVHEKPIHEGEHARHEGQPSGVETSSGTVLGGATDA